MSPRNSVQGICHLIQATNCRRTLYGSTTAALVKRVNAGMKEQGVELQLDELSVLKGILSDLIAGNLAAVSSFEPYPASRTPVDLDAPMLYLHSSGSTGLPKAIPFKQEQALQSLRRSNASVVGTKMYYNSCLSQISLALVIAKSASVGWDYRLSILWECCRKFSSRFLP